MGFPVAAVDDAATTCATHKRTSLRLAPFYGDSQFGDLHSHFVLWPLYRWRTQDLDDYQYRRSDVFWVIYRDIDEAQPQSRHRRHVRTLSSPISIGRG